MDIPIDRPLIDARNLRAAATQTITANAFTLQHNNRPVILISLDPDGPPDTFSSTNPAIADGTVIGQKLRIILFSIGAGHSIVIEDNANTKLQGNWNRSAVESWLEVTWDGSDWVQTGANDGIGNAVTGANAHGEGLSNTASGPQSHAEGNDNTASGTYSHAEGKGNTASGQSSHAEGGDGGIASGTRSHVEGRGSDATDQQAHAEGEYTLASADAAHSEGLYTKAEGNYSHAKGVFAQAGLYAESAHSSGAFATYGDSQFSRVVMRKNTTDATLTELFIDGVDDRLTILNEYTYACKVMVVGRQDTGVDHFMGTYHVLIQRTDSIAGVALVGAVDVIYENNAGGLGAGGGLPVEITAANNALTIKVEGLAAHNIRWVAVVEMVRVNYAD